MLEIQHISKSFFRNLALDDISLRIEAGEIFGLLGPNGAGKTTLIRIINRIIEADNGSVRINGDLMTQQHLSMIGYLPEERGLYRTMTVEDHALFLGQLRGLSKKDVKTQLEYWLEKFDIADWRKKRIEELSKGMAQKVQFICTVLHEPKLLILDEPLSGFDPVNVELIKQELLEMKAKGKTIILSTHNMRSVEEICDRAALIHQSKKIMEGRISEIQEARKTGEFAIKFRGSMIAFVTALWTSFELTDKEILGDDKFIARVKMRGDKESGNQIKKSILSDKNRTLFSLSFCLDTKERKNQVSIEAVRRKSLSDRYSKRVHALAYKRQALFGIGSASKFSSPSLCQSSHRFYEAFKSFHNVSIF